VAHGAQSESQEVQPHTCSIFGGDGGDWDGPREEAYPQVKWSYCMDGELLWTVSYIHFHACMDACYLLSMFNQCWFYGADSNQCVFLTQSGRFSTRQTGNPPSQLLDQAKTAYEDVWRTSDFCIKRDHLLCPLLLTVEYILPSRLYTHCT